MTVLRVHVVSFALISFTRKLTYTVLLLFIFIFIAFCNVNPKESTDCLLEQKKVHTATGYKMNIKKSVLL